MSAIQLLVLAGGFGTRLRSAVSNVPKPLAPVKGKPFLYYQIQSWKSQGVTNYTFLLHHRADMMVSFLKKEEKGILKDCEFSWIIESKPLGTGGSVANCIRESNIKGEFLVTNADTWLDSGFKELAEEIAPTMALVELSNTARYGKVQVKGSNIVSFKEKSYNQMSGLINAGLCLLSKDIFDNISEKQFSLEEKIYPLLALRNNFKFVKLNTLFIDIGIPEDYYSFIKRVENGEIEL